MEYGSASPDPAGGIRGFNSSMARRKTSSGYADGSIPEACIEEVLSVPPVPYSSLILPPDIPGNFSKIPQSTELPQCVMSAEDQDTSQTDSGQESEVDGPNIANPMGGDWLQTDEEEDLEATEEEDGDEENDGVIQSEERLSNELEGWQSPANETEDYEEIWGSESEEAASAERSSTESETESSGTHLPRHEVVKNQALKSSLKSNKTLSSDSVLCFDEYGNLTTYRPEVPASPPMPPPAKVDVDKISNQDFLEAAETLESDMNESLNLRSSESVETFPRERQKLEIKPLRNKANKHHESGEPCSMSDQDLKQVFKQEVLTTETSRYGRARKRKTEDGFFFGTINFNELRKITSTVSPKKGKGIPGNSKSPEQKSKSSKDDDRPRTSLDEAFESVIQNGPVDHSPDPGMDRHIGDVDNFRNELEPHKDKSDIDKVQNSISNEVNTYSNNSYVGQMEKEGSKKGLSKEEKVSLKNDIKPHKGKGRPRKEVKKETVEAAEREGIPELQRTELKTTLDDDVEIIKLAEIRKRLSLPRRNELSRLRENESSVFFTSERMLRGRSDVDRIKNALQATNKPVHSRKRAPKNNALLEKENNGSANIKSLPNVTQPSSLPSDVKATPINKNEQNSDTVKSRRGRRRKLDRQAAGRTRKLLRNSVDSAVLLQTSDGLSEGQTSDVADALKTSKVQDLAVLAVESQDLVTSQIQNSVTDVNLPKSSKDCLAHKKSAPASIEEEDELGATTKSGRLIRKPQLMDISVEAKKQKMEQLRNKELLTTSFEEEVALPALDQKALEKEHPCEHMVGDVVWVQLKGNPLWPAMISYNPESGEFTKLSVKYSWLGKASCQRLYFVQFFSDNCQTYWITPNSVLPFEGYDKLKDYLNSLKEEIKFMKSYQKIHSKGLLNTLLHINKLSKGISSGQKGERWLNAIDEGERAMVMDRYERLQKFTLHPKNSKMSVSSQEKEMESPLRKNNTLGRKRKIGRPRKDSLKSKVSLDVPKSSDDGVSSDTEFSGFDENYSSDENRNVSNLISDISSGNKESFAQYASKHLQKFILENPNISETAARTKLRWRWKKLLKSQAVITRKLKGETKLERKTKNSENATLKRKCRNSVERDEVDDLDESAYKRKKLDDSKDNQKGVYKVVRNEKVCYICESASTQSGADMIRCKGVCFGIFHLSCVGLSSVPKQDFKCVECQTGEHLCFCCKSAVGPKQKCTVPFCGKFYHEECILQWPQVSKNRHQEKFVCPRHICHMCAANADDMNDPVARNPTFTRCLRCPTTYHTGEECLAAGSEEISLNHHICTKHLKLAKNNLNHVNVSWCFCCSKGGSLLLCDQCPAAFHADCMKITAPEGSYVCEDCENGKFPVYGDVVWVKLGLYRWWPGQVLHPRYIPDNIENLSHEQGMFCVHFFGSNDYYWVTRGRAFHYQEGDKGSKAASSKTLEMQFQKAIEEALVAYRTHRARKAQLEAVRSGKGNLKPPPYVRIDSNRPVGNVRLNKLDLAAVNRCDCDPYSENPCGSDEKCLNRMLMFECVREVCGAGDTCGNQRFQKRLYANVSSFRTEARGWGLKTLDNIKKGDFVIEYVGELIDDEEFQRRIEDMHKVKEENYYFLTIDKDIMIDAGPKGNLARFMNHSCEPNCETQKWTVGGDTRVGLFATSDIPAGTELTFNYNLQCVGTEKKICNCGSANCSGFIGAKVQKNDSNGPKREKLGRRKRKRKRREIKISEDECYRCGGAGDLILCDVTACPKSYHLQCLSLDKLPKGKWICPWHHCDECGQRSIKPNRCDYCPNSFCRQHAVGNLHHVPGVGNVCEDHDTEDIETLRGQMEAKVAAEITFSDQNYMDMVDESAMDEEKSETSSASYETAPLFVNDASVDKSSSCTYENSKKSVVSNSSQECDQIDSNAPVSASVIGPLGLKRNRSRHKKSDRASEGHENNSSVINVNSDASFPQINSKTYPNKSAVPPRNGIRSTRNTPRNVSKVLHVL